MLRCGKVKRVGGMKITLDVRKGAMENAAAYFEKAKGLRAKAEGARKAIGESEREMARLEAESGEAALLAPAGQAVRIKREKEWFERFRNFESSGLLCIGGRDAGQNEQLVARYFEEGDLFFHADIQGAAAVIVKGGEKAGGQILTEAAQFSASYSNAWKNGNASVDVYAVGKGQVSKHSHGGFLPKGGFAIEGERKWFRGVALGLRIGVREGVPAVLPACAAGKLEKEVLIEPGEKERGEAAREIAKRLGCGADEVLALLPAGKMMIKG